jgi:hypothetical protein
MTGTLVLRWSFCVYDAAAAFKVTARLNVNRPPTTFARIETLYIGLANSILYGVYFPKYPLLLQFYRGQIYGNRQPYLYTLRF